MNKGKLYVELTRKNMFKEAVAILRGRKNKFSSDEVAEILDNKKIISKVKKQVSKKSIKLKKEESFEEEVKEITKPKKKKKKSKK